jgi:GTPase SAR1 family protein
MAKKTLRVMIVGGSAVGKTAFMNAAAEVFEGGKVEKKQTGTHVINLTLLVTAKIPLEMDGTQYELLLSPFYDTGLTDNDIQQVQKADGFIVIYDVTNKFSVDRVQIYKKKIEKSNVSPALVLVGNKSDMKNEREVKVEDGLKLGDEFGCAYFEVSSKPNYKGVEDAFKEIVRVIEKQRKSNKSEGGCHLM